MFIYYNYFIFFLKFLLVLENEKIISFIKYCIIIMHNHACDKIIFNFGIFYAICCTFTIAIHLQ
ncbi:ORF MSV075 hypothetical protein [Melanoplus sanguinipes entomopoxvirus]|uniref:Uncharacterized protein n=1 Tax=Melanoplus sanguinipes entomopoxvirus TaxID=83191 RepID=Q9YW16_MSEPV|nr:ORF MSV075 hypothetical protein [Melanoplus sanguinipes entomopoxvirus]AAC97631.1 ORF MSV075 hypothetical protein [Melanoplus sanguinipes entomopoxvirus 'O']